MPLTQDEQELRPPGESALLRTSCGSARAAGDEATVCQAKRLALIEDRDVRPRDCVPVYGRVRACSRSTAQQTATTAVGLELGSEDGLNGTIGFDGERSCDPAESA